MIIFDIDQTLVDSSVRENLSSNEKGELCLYSYLAIKSCPENGIINDRLLPLGVWLEFMSDSIDFCLVTARQITNLDLASLAELMPRTMANCRLFISRNNCHEYGSNALVQSSAEYKKPIFNTLKTFYGDCLAIDDCHKVLAMAKKQGIATLEAQNFYHCERVEVSRIMNDCLHWQGKQLTRFL